MKVSILIVDFKQNVSNTASRHLNWMDNPVQEQYIICGNNQLNQDEV